MEVPRADLTLNVALALAGLAALALACLFGATPVTPASVVKGLFGLGGEAERIIVQEIRLPRALAAYLVGAALGASGAALQGLLRNPLAEPGVLGVSATASLAAAGAIYFGAVTISPFFLPAFAILGALGATALIAAAAVMVRSVATLILVGVGLSSFAAAAMALLMNLAPHPFTLSDMVSWMLGTVANRSLEDIALAGPFLLAGLGILAAFRGGLSALTLGEEAAAGIGADLRALRLAVIGGAGLATGAGVALAGAVGFVGIVAPHIVRPWVDHDPARTLLPAALMSGIILVFADIFIRILPTAAELKLGVVAALIGAPIFILIAVQRRPAHV